MQGLVRSRSSAPFAILNRKGLGGVVLICEHASNYVPHDYQRLGLTTDDLQRHIAWDIGALALAERLSALLDAPLVFATHSRLVIDVNRDVAAMDSIVTQSEGTQVPGNVDLSQIERRWRCDWLYSPFHAAIETLVDERLSRGLTTAVISIHSFTPEFHGIARPWHVGVISRRDRRLADLLLESLRRDAHLHVGDNQPYAPEQGVYHSIDRHAEHRGLPGAMIEVRNDLIANSPDQTQWARRLAVDFKWALERCTNTGVMGMRAIAAEAANH